MEICAKLYCRVNTWVNFIFKRLIKTVGKRVVNRFCTRAIELERSRNVPELRRPINKDVVAKGRVRTKQTFCRSFYRCFSQFNSWPPSSAAAAAALATPSYAAALLMFTDRCRSRTNCSLDERFEDVETTRRCVRPFLRSCGLCTLHGQL